MVEIQYKITSFLLSVASGSILSGANLIYQPVRNRPEGDKAVTLLFIKIICLFIIYESTN